MDLERGLLESETKTGWLWELSGVAQNKRMKNIVQRAHYRPAFRHQVPCGPLPRTTPTSCWPARLPACQARARSLAWRGRPGDFIEVREGEKGGRSWGQATRRRATTATSLSAWRKRRLRHATPWGACVTLARAAVSTSHTQAHAETRTAPAPAPASPPSATPTTPPAPFDVILSSGFLAFAAHSGFLQAVEDARLTVGAVVGTSAGALTGALWCAGHSAAGAAAELMSVPPIARLRPCGTPWAGLMSLEGVVARLRDLLPPTFEDLEREFAVCVVGADGRHTILSSGPLPEAVAASAAIPGLFAPVAIPGREGSGPFADGGVVDRTGLTAWRARRRAGTGGAATTAAPPPALVHLIGRSSAFSGDDDVARTGETRVILVKSPKAGVSLVSLGGAAFDFQLASARSRARPAMRDAVEGRWSF